MAPIEWKNIRWPEGKRAEAYLTCEQCGGVMHEHDKPRLAREGKWKATAEGDGRTASFHLSALYSPFLTWVEVALEHGAARNDPPRMQAWQNLMLAEPYEDVAARPAAVSWLAARAENYEAAPQGVSVVTAGVDVQDDRVEVELLGFGLGDESWSLRPLRRPKRARAWEELDALLRERVPHESGRQVRIRAACIDSGGHHTVAVYNFVRDKQAHGRGLDYYAGLTSERPIRKYHKGVARRVWTKAQGARIEPLDSRILAMAALEGLKASGLRLARISIRVRPARRRSMAEWSSVFNG